jgi:hypothetical protein
MPADVGENIELGEWVFIIAGVALVLYFVKKGASATGGALSGLLDSIGLGATPPASIQSENQASNAILANCYPCLNAKYLATIVPGTGNTVGELLKLGYTQKQINGMITCSIGKHYCCTSPNCGNCPEKCPSLQCCCNSGQTFSGIC